ncbi:GlsB/YeaQ/YmgE family stress response membrane protein [Methylocystis sp. JR02]|nr:MULTISPECIES: GlsB/YeaQ/YmgE family stress response membrane protein [Methylocystis]MDJ0450912.1 GlsB/YeaQ/YmgE family stress response membrane protein [Methylocystis sp. JR02]
MSGQSARATHLSLLPGVSGGRDEPAARYSRNARRRIFRPSRHWRVSRLDSGYGYTGVRNWVLTNILVGVAGSWIGSQLADLLGIVVRGSLGHFIAAIAGSILIITVWQRFHPGAGQGYSDKYPSI